MILLTSRSGDRIHGTRMGEHLVLRHQSSSTAMGNHETRVQTATLLHSQERIQSTQRAVHQTLDSTLRNITNFVNSNGQEIESLGRILSMEVSSRNDYRFTIIITENHRIIGSRIQFGSDNSTHELQCIMSNTMDLRGATKCV